MSELWFSILDTILFAIPEAIFVTAMTYTLLKRYDLIDIYKIKFTLVNLLLPSVSSTVIMMIMCYFKLDIIGKIIGLFLFYVLLLIVTKKNTYIKIIRLNIKLLICFLLSFFILMIVESICMLSLMGMLKINSFNLLNNNNNFDIKIITVFSWFIIESLVIIIFNIKKNNKFITILQTILKNKELLKISLLIITTTMFSMIVFIYLVLFNNLLINIDLFWQINITIGIVFVLPLSVILFIGKTVILLINSEKRFQQLYQEIDN